jgi:hypothetical protein
MYGTRVRVSHNKFTNFWKRKQRKRKRIVAKWQPMKFQRFASSFHIARGTWPYPPQIWKLETKRKRLHREKLKRNYSNQMELHVVNQDPRRQRIDVFCDKDGGVRKSERSVGIFPDNGECLPLQKLAGTR